MADSYFDEFGFLRQGIRVRVKRDIWDALEEIELISRGDAKSIDYHDDPVPFYTIPSLSKRAIYAFGRFIIKKQKFDTLSDAVLEIQKAEGLRFVDGRTVSCDVNPFFWIYKGAFPHNDYISSGELSRFSRSMIIAYLCDIQPCHLIGFMYQVGGKRFLDNFSYKEMYDNIGNTSLNQAREEFEGQWWKLIN